MKKSLISLMGMLTLFFMVYTHPTERLEQYATDSLDEPMVTEAYVNAEVKAITVSQTTIVPNWKGEFTLPASVVKPLPLQTSIPYEFSFERLYSSDSSGFIDVIKYQSNYL
ncbi:hypothetical protein [Halobacillus amylolyticus]|uniref:DUF3888 domain-containing protein n=1 Tax=Halobacillus amylolyticus TaxID=2932259 RepID=A0ABY4H8W1_9BACI|nr:hypothetical protein [Halobacillus amylolyticus]UOR11144.1 hypothetical protein MUO15_16300 [Halobacillus amylolyticus]